MHDNGYDPGGSSLLLGYAWVAMMLASVMDHPATSNAFGIGRLSNVVTKYDFTSPGSLYDEFEAPLQHACHKVANAQPSLMVAAAAKGNAE